MPGMSEKQLRKTFFRPFRSPRAARFALAASPSQGYA